MTYGDWEISVNRVTRASDMIYVELASTYTGEEDSSDVDDLEFCLTGYSHKLYTDQESGESPEPVFGDGYGEEQIREGWISFEVPKTESSLILAVRHSSTIFRSDANFRYFGLEKDSGIDSDFSSAADPTEVGVTIDSPVPLSEVAVTSSFALEISEALIGEDAADRLSEVSFLNPEPGEDKEFWLFKVDVENVSSTISPSSISRFQFSADGFLEVHAYLFASSLFVSGTGSGVGTSAIFSPFLELPGQELEASLYPGGSFEGWVLLEVDVGTDPVVVYDPSIGGGIAHDPDRRYFALEEVE